MSAGSAAAASSASRSHRRATAALASFGRRRAGVGLALTILLAAVLRARHLAWGLPDLFEEATPFFQAWDMWHWGPPLSVDLDPHFFRYPSLTFYAHFATQGIVAAFLRATGAISSLADVPVEFLADRSRFLLASRAVTALFGVATVGAVFVLGRRAGGVAVGLAAATWLAVSPFHVERSQFIEVDVPLVLFIAWGLAECLRLVDEPTLRGHLRAGAVVGLAVSAKYTGAFLVVPLVAAHVLARREKGVAGWARASRLLAAGGAAAAVFAITSPYVLLDFGHAWQDFRTEQEHMQRGHFGSDTSLAWREYASALPSRALGWPIALAAAAGLVVATVVRRRPATAVLAAFVISYGLVVGSWSMRSERYLLPLVPPLLVLAATFVSDLARPRRGAWLPLATLALAVPSLAGLPAAYARGARDTRTAAREWIESRCPSGAFLLLEAWGPDLLEPEDLWKLPPASRERCLARSARPLYAIQYLPTYQVQPELSDAFYDTDLVPDADLVVLSSVVGDRFRAEPARFAREVRFYEGIEANWTRVAEFRPEAGLSGPTIRVFAQRRHAAPFSRRPEVADATELTSRLPPGFPGAAPFYARLGLNYETFGFIRTALACYECGLRATSFPPTTLEGLAAGMGRCLLAQRRPAEAADRMARLAQSCPFPAERRRILAFEEGLRALVTAPGAVLPVSPPSKEGS